LDAHGFNVSYITHRDDDDVKFTTENKCDRDKCRSSTLFHAVIKLCKADINSYE